MRIKQVEHGPRDLQWIDQDELASRMTSENVEDIVEIFKTPLTGAYNWDYTEADNRIKKLYELGKELNWNGSIILDWESGLSHDEWPVDPETVQFKGFPHYEALSEKEKIDFCWHLQAQSLSNFLHGEQGALLVASQLVSCAPTYNAKLYAASQTFDEARHVEVFNRYLHQKVGRVYPCTEGLKLLLDKVLTDERWDLKFIGMQIIIEGLALAAFNSMKRNTRCPLLSDLVHYVLRDEARHVTFGINYLEDFIKTLSEEERDARADFAFEACYVMRNRMLPLDVIKHFGWDKSGAVEVAQNSQGRMQFRSLLFTRVMPNLRRIGLLTDKIMPKYEQLGLLEYADAQEDDFETNWDDLTKPLSEGLGQTGS